MKKNIIRRLTPSWLLALPVALTVCRLEAAELNLLGTNMPPFDFHGFISQGYLATSKYNYLANDNKDGSFEFTEAGLNVSMNPFPRTHITAQGFLFDVGNVGEYNLALDYASIDYNFCDAFGVRAGRIRRPVGIYNAIQDIDLARTSVLLPQGMYDSRWRDFTEALDGGSVYGDIGLSKAGSMSYEAYGGWVSLAQNGGIARLLQDSLNHPPYTTFSGVHGFPAVGFQLWWNTPVNGLRAGVAAYEGFGFSYDYWISPMIGGPGAVRGYTDHAMVIQPSLEYLWKNWTFQAEYKYQDYSGHNEGGGMVIGTSDNIEDTWYVGAACRVNKWLEIGSYYTEFYADVDDRDGSTYPGKVPPQPSSDAYQKDLALSFRFDPKPWWVFKVEGHYIRGTGLLYDGADNPVRNGDGWFMIAVKTTFSF
jgi:hypothetical protein